jgi:hypothetical protein
MKTTLEIPGALLRRAKSEAAERGITLQALVSEALDDKLRAHDMQDKPWMRAFAKLRGLHNETAKIDQIIEQEFGRIQSE